MKSIRSLVYGLLVALLLHAPLDGAVAPMGVYKGARGGSTAPSYSDYAGIRQFETWFGAQVPRSIDFLASGSWAEFDGAVTWTLNSTSGWPPQRWRATYSVPMLADDGVSTLAQGAAGAYDAHFAQLAATLVANGEGDAVIRLGWEMNGSWYAWHVLNATQAADYRAYWIRIVTAMRAVPGAAFKFDFCPAMGRQAYPPNESYPGDAYVDFIGLDVYNESFATSDPTARWSELMNQTYGIKYWADFATAHGKRVSYPEWGTGVRPGSTSGGGDDPAFIENMFNWISTHDVAYHNYWDYQANDFQAQLSNGQYPNSAAKFKELFGQIFAANTSAPENLSATAGNGQVALTWSAVSGATSYNIQRSSTIGHTFTTVASATVTNFTDSGLTNGATYYYVVTAVKNGVESGPSSRVPAVPIDAVIVDDADPNGVTITGAWTSSTSGDGYYGKDYLHDGSTGTIGGKTIRFTPTLPAAGDYRVYARWTSGANRATNTPIDVTHAAGDQAFVVNQQFNGGGWFPLGTFSFGAGSAGSVAISNPATNGYVIADAIAFIATSAPQPPAVVVGVNANAGDRQVSLTWTASDGATSYDLKRAVASGGPYATIASDLVTTNFSDTGLANGVIYYYTLSAKNAVGRAADSTPLSAAPVGPTTAPTGLSAVGGDARVLLTWTATSGATSYNVKRATTTGGPYATIATGVTTASFTDTSVVNQTTYYYVVSTTNAYGESADSAETAAKPRAEVIIDNTDTAQVTLTGAWTVSTSATTYYGTNYLHDGNTGTAGGKRVRYTPTFSSPVSADVYARWPAGTNRASNTPIDITHAAGTTTIVANQRNNDGLWVLLGRFNFNAGTAGNLTVRNDGANGFVMADAVKFVIDGGFAAPGAPTGLVATPGDAQVSLSWTGSTSATSYHVKRATSATGPFTTIGNPSSANFTDTGLTNGATYYYVVSGLNAGGEGSDSSVASATPWPDAGLTIQSVSSGRAYTIGTAAIGEIYTIDRTFKITALSPTLTNHPMIRTAYDDKSLTTASHLTFTLGKAATVYVCYDARATSLPGFLDSTWTLTEETFSTTHTLASPFKVFAKEFPAGSVTLGGNLQPPAAGTWGASAAHYVVIVVPTVTAAITFGDLEQTYDGTPKMPTATTAPGGLAVTISYAGSSTPPTNVGSYAITATVTTPHFTGSAAGTFIITKATPRLTWAAPDAIGYGSLLDGTQLNATANVAGSFVYSPAAGAQLSAGEHTLSATFTPADLANFEPTSVATMLTVEKAIANVTLSQLARVYDGAPKSATVATTPVNLATSVTYNGAVTPPISAGSYAVVATVTDSNYAGQATGTLVITKANASITLGALTQAYDGTPRVATATTSPEGLAVEVLYAGGSPTAPIYPGVHSVTATINDPNYQASTAGTLTITTTALVRHGPTLEGWVDGSLQVLSAEDVTLNGDAALSSDLLLTGSPAIVRNGSPLIGSIIDGPGAAAPTNYRVVLNGPCVARAVVRRVDPVAMPVVSAPPLPSGSRSVTLNRASDSVGNFATLRNLTLNGNAGSIAIPPGHYGDFTANSGTAFILGVAGTTDPVVYDFQHLTINDLGQLRVVSPVRITLANGSTLSGLVGDPAHPRWLELRVASGGVTLNGSAQLHGDVIAPSGTVNLNDTTVLNGTAACDRLILNEDATLGGESQP